MTQISEFWGCTGTMPGPTNHSKELGLVPKAFTNNLKQKGATFTQNISINTKIIHPKNYNTYLGVTLQWLQ